MRGGLGGRRHAADVEGILFGPEADDHDPIAILSKESRRPTYKSRICRLTLPQFKAPKDEQGGEGGESLALDSQKRQEGWKSGV